MTTKITIDSSIQKLIVDSAANLIADIQNDIDLEKELSDRTYQTCTSILEQATNEYKRVQVGFTEDTKLLVEKALNQPNENFHKHWTKILDIYVSECEKITGPILQVINAVSRESARLKSKYWWYITGTATGAAVATFLAVALVCHYTAAVCFTLSAGAIPLAVGGLVIAVALVIVCIRGAISMTQLYDAYNRCESTVKILWVKYMPKIFGNPKPTITQNDLLYALNHALNSFKIEEETWTDMVSLQLLQSQLTRRLNELK